MPGKDKTFDRKTLCFRAGRQECVKSNIFNGGGYVTHPKTLFPPINVFICSYMPIFLFPLMYLLFIIQCMYVYV